MDGHAIPQGVLRELPADPADMLAVAHQVAAFAFASKAAQGDAEVGQVRQLLTQRQSETRALERRCDELEAELAHSRAEARRAAAEGERLTAEKLALVDSVKQLSKELLSEVSQVARLEAFKRNVLKTLNDEAVETVDHTAAPPAYTPALELPSAVKSFAPTSVTTTQGGAPDGKVFFRTARARLAPDAFAALLASIKALNAHTRSRPQTLEDARTLFGPTNTDLYEEFQELLSLHLSS